MRQKKRSAGRCGAWAGVVLLALPAAAAHTHAARRNAEAPLSAREQAQQVLDRFSFGPQPGQIAAVAAEGWEQWFTAQLHPGSIPDAALDARLAQYPSLSMSPQQLAVHFPDGAVLRRIAAGNAEMPADGRLAAVYRVLLFRYEQKQAEEKAAAAASPAPDGSATSTPSLNATTLGETQPNRAASRADRPAERERAQQLAGPILLLAPNARLDAVLALPVPDAAVLTRDLPGPERGGLLAGVTPQDREFFLTMAGGAGARGVAAAELQQTKVLRAVLSQRQLQEVLTDFWLNHFNIDLAKSGDEINYAGEYERDVIRPHALGKFRDLLLATAESPAMMIYLDNATSVGPDSPAAERAGKNGAGKGKDKRGLNENYGREVMELHTIGVNGGYTQADVTALASILTGWGVDQPQAGGPFAFTPRRHEPGAKQWMGRTLDEDGMQQGITALTALADSPATARHVSTELARRFVADDPSPDLVDRMVAAWEASDGDIATVLTAMVHAPEFFARDNFHNKVKSPLEFVSSTLRAAEIDPSNPAALVAELRTMGEEPYRCLPPTGYSNIGASWMSSAALVDRLNFAAALGDGRFGGMEVNGPLLVADAVLDAQPPHSAGVPGSHAAVLRYGPDGATGRSGTYGQQESLALLERALLGGAESPATTAVIEQQIARQYPAGASSAPLADAPAELDQMAAMVLGSPSFQLR